MNSKSAREGGRISMYSKSKRFIAGFLAVLMAVCLLPADVLGGVGVVHAADPLTASMVTVGGKAVTGEGSSCTTEYSAAYADGDAAVEPEVEVADASKDVDYTVAYADNTGVGTAKITITPIDGSDVLEGDALVISFAITEKVVAPIKKTLAAAMVKIGDAGVGADNVAEYTAKYSDTAINLPAVTIDDCDEATDFTYVFKDAEENVVNSFEAAGDYTVTVSPVSTSSKLEGTDVVITIKITEDTPADTRTDLADKTITVGGEAVTVDKTAKTGTTTYSTAATGSKIEPEVAVDGCNADDDYDLLYGENTAVGDGTVTITPKESSAKLKGDAITVTFTIKEKEGGGSTGIKLPYVLDFSKYDSSKTPNPADPSGVFSLPENVSSAEYKTVSDGTIAKTTDSTLSGWTYTNKITTVFVLGGSTTGGNSKRAMTITPKSDVKMTIGAFTNSYTNSEPVDVELVVWAADATKDSLISTLTDDSVFEHWSIPGGKEFKEVKTTKALEAGKTYSIGSLAKMRICYVVLEDPSGTVTPQPTKKDLSTATVTFANESVKYTGENVTNAVTVKIGGEDVDGADYDVTYARAKADGAEPGDGDYKTAEDADLKSVGKVYVKVSAKQGSTTYENSKTAEFNIVKGDAPEIKKAEWPVDVAGATDEQKTAGSMPQEISLGDLFKFDAKYGTVEYKTVALADQEGAENNVLADDAAIAFKAGSDNKVITFNSKTEIPETQVPATIKVGVEFENYEPAELVIELRLASKEAVTITGITFAQDAVYTGKAAAPILDGLKIQTGEGEGAADIAAADLEAIKEAGLDLAYAKAGAGNEYAPVDEAVDAGDYKLVASIPQGNLKYTGSSAEVAFTIGKAPLTITAADRSWRKGTAAPAAAGPASWYTVAGLVNSETLEALETEPAFAYKSGETEVTDWAALSKGDTVTIVPSLELANYEVTAVNGTLTVVEKEPLPAGQHELDLTNDWVVEKNAEGKYVISYSGDGSKTDGYFTLGSGTEPKTASTNNSNPLVVYGEYTQPLKMGDVKKDSKVTFNAPKGSVVELIVYTNTTAANLAVDDTAVITGKPAQDTATVVKLGAGTVPTPPDGEAKNVPDDLSVYKVTVTLAADGAHTIARPSTGGKDEPLLYYVKVTEPSNECTITFMDGDTEKTDLKVETTKGTAVDLTGKTLTEAGKVFKGWATTKNAAAAEYTDSITPTGDTTLYAVWKNLYTVTLKKGGTTIDNGVKTVEEGQTLELPALEDNDTDGYFMGWKNADATDTTVYTAGITPTKDTTLVAEYSKEKNFYEVTRDYGYKANDADQGNKTDVFRVTRAAAGDKVKITLSDLGTPERAGYTFDKWMVGDPAAEVTAAGYEIDKDTTFTATWKTAATPTTLKSVALSGTAKVNKVLTATPTFEPVTPAPSADKIAYAWYKVSSTDVETLITGETSSTYRIKSEDEGSKIRVKVTFTKDDNTTDVESATSAVVEAGGAGTGEGLEIEFEEGRVYTYTGTAIKPAIIVTNNGNPLVEGTDYTVKYTNNTKAGKAPESGYEKKAPGVTVTGKGNLSGKVSANFTINPKALDNIDADAANETVDVIAKKVVVVESAKAAPVVLYNGVKLTAKDYDVTAPSDIKSKKWALTDVDETTHTATDAITLTAKDGGNFTGTCTLDVVVIEKAKAKDTKIKADFTDKTGVKNLVYTGASIKPEFTVSNKAGASDLVLDTDYVISYPADTTSAGAKKVTILGISEKCSGSVNKSYTIKPAKGGELNVSGVKDSYDFVSTGVTFGDEVTVSYVDTANSIDLKLTEGVDYKITYSNNKKAGTAKYAVAGLGNYKGLKTAKTDFTISGLALENGKDNIKVIAADKIFNKPGVYKSAPYVIVNGALVKSSEYTVSYKVGDGDWAAKPAKIESIDAELGYTTVKVQIKAKKPTGNYGAAVEPGSELEGEYKVVSSDTKKDLAKAKIVFYDKDGAKAAKVGYTGNAVKPYKAVITCKDVEDVTIILDETDTENFKSDYDGFEVTYANNELKGKATVVIKASSDNAKYAGSKAATFSIVQKNLQKDLGEKEGFINLTSLFKSLFNN